MNFWKRRRETSRCGESESTYIQQGSPSGRHTKEPIEEPGEAWTSRARREEKKQWRRLIQDSFEAR